VKVIDLRKDLLRRGGDFDLPRNAKVSGPQGNDNCQNCNDRRDAA
jgi:hypothetical protein